MKKIAIVGCGAYMDSGYGCPGEWRCLKAAALGDGKIEEQSSVVSFIKCECPGRTLVPNIGMAMKLSEIKPEEIYLSSCLVNAKPDCPYSSSEEMKKMIEGKTGIKVIFGTHDYH
ncbi:MAG: CGGC domain-containing protein [Desulfobacterales bacterium]|nr:CGGC domain-containing protein [Desulfobacteraceae bacterium]MBT4365135.1 CGGC domain-containing protein [Desulfobacteraceae bacterium]MBT7698308.1 CGGC domain-containing protein [Desulfobacterales bacterium]